QPACVQRHSSDVGTPPRLFCRHPDRVFTQSLGDRGALGLSHHQFYWRRAGTSLRRVAAKTTPVDARRLHASVRHSSPLLACTTIAGTLRNGFVSDLFCVG